LLAVIAVVADQIVAEVGSVTCQAIQTGNKKKVGKDATNGRSVFNTMNGAEKRKKAGGYTSNTPHAPLILLN
jgi:hypothetical protein